MRLGRVRVALWEHEASDDARMVNDRLSEHPFQQPQDAGVVRQRVEALDPVDLLVDLHVFRFRLDAEPGQIRDTFLYGHLSADPAVGGPDFQKLHAQGFQRFRRQ